MTTEQAACANCSAPSGCSRTRCRASTRSAAPDDPVTLFLRWLEAAIQDAVPAPHAMTLATADDRGRPSVPRPDLQRRGHRRPLVLRFQRGQRQGPGSRCQSRAPPCRSSGPSRDARSGFAARPSRRAAGQRRRLPGPAGRLPGRADGDEVEFWQGDPERRHVRLRYQRTASAWTRHLLGPDSARLSDSDPRRGKRIPAGRLHASAPRSWPSGVPCGSTPASTPAGPWRLSTGCWTSARPGTAR